MTKFTISFLIGFDADTRRSTAKDNTKNIKEAGLNRGLKKTVSFTMTVVPDNERHIKSSSANNYCHIEYTIIPNRIAYNVDVVCYGTCAKVYTDCGEATQRTVQQTNCTWCFVTVEHSLRLTHDELLHLIANTVTIKYYPNASRIRSAARKATKSGDLYLNPKHLAFENYFPPLHSTDMLQTLSIWSDGTMDSETSSIEEDIVTYILDNLWERFIYETGGVVDHISENEYHSARIKLFLEKTARGLKPEPNKPNIPYAFCKPSSTKTSSRQSKSNQPIDSSFPGEMLFTNAREMLLEPSSTKPPLRRAFCLISSEELLTSQQITDLCPIVMGISNIRDLPLQQLLDGNFHHVYVRSSTVYGDITTNQYPLVGCNVNIQETRAFFTDDSDRIRLLSFLQYGQILIEVRGIRSLEENKPHGHLFGAANTDYYLNRPFNRVMKRKYKGCLDEKEKSDVLLCIGLFSLKFRLFKPWFHLDSATCYVTDSLRHSNSIEPSWLRLDTLLELNTCVNITFGLFNSLQGELLSYLSTDMCYSRIVFLTSNQAAAVELLYMMYAHNYNYQVRGGFSMPTSNIYQPQWSLGSISAEDSPTPVYITTHKSIITGFYVDSGGKTLIYLEGIATGFVHEVWLKIGHNLKKSQRLWYNSDQIYPKRYYKKFLEDNPIYEITLKEPLEILCQQSLTHLEGSMPALCQRALQKLNILFMEASMCMAAEHCLFPLAEELMALNKEFGLPLEQLSSVQYAQTY